MQCLPRLITVTALSVFVGCSSSPTGNTQPGPTRTRSDAATTNDASSAPDAGTLADSGSVADSGASSDAFVADSATPADGGQPNDGGVATDAAGPDSALEPDAAARDAAPPDSGATSDAGTPDSGAVADTGTPDSGATPDAGPRPDAGPPIPCTVSSGLDNFINGRMAQNNIPGLAAAIVGANGVLWSRGYGFADIAAQQPATPDTIFAIMSISKVVTAVGVMQVVEAGTVDLDADVNDYLSTFAITHPSFPNRPLTTRQLLSHASGIGGDDYGVLQLNIRTDDASVEPLGSMLQSLLTPMGARWNGGANWANHAPTDAFAYSSIAISLAGYVAESATGTPFDQLTDVNIFQRLGMTNTSWRLTPYLNRNDVAVMYHYVGGGSGYDIVDRFTFADYPAGSIRSSVNEFSRFLAAMINEGSFDGAQILTPATAAAMTQVPFPAASSSQAIGWGWTFGARDMLGHGGDDAGASTDMRYDVATRKGALLFMNVTRRPNTDEIIDRLMDESDACN